MLVERDFLSYGVFEVNTQLVCESKQVDQHIANLLADGSKVVGGERATFLRSEPLKMLQQFTRLHAQGHRQVLRRVELVPVPLLGEGAELVGKSSD